MYFDPDETGFPCESTTATPLTLEQVLLQELRRPRTIEQLGDSTPYNLEQISEAVYRLHRRGVVAQKLSSPTGPGGWALCYPLERWGGASSCASLEGQSPPCSTAIPANESRQTHRTQRTLLGELQEEILHAADQTEERAQGFRGLQEELASS